MTIAQQLKIKQFPFKINDSKGKEIYYEDSNGYWEKREFDYEGNRIYCEDSNGAWIKREFDSKNNQIYFENSNEFWVKRKYDSKGKEIYWETSDGAWIKREFDSEGNRIYYEDSKKKIINKHPMTDDQKKLEKFKKDFSELLSKHPEITVCGDINGDPIASCFDKIKTTTIKLIDEGGSRD
jgi:hypothetical protein